MRCMRALASMHILPSIFLFFFPAFLVSLFNKLFLFSFNKEMDYAVISDAWKRFEKETKINDHFEIIIF